MKKVRLFVNKAIAQHSTQTTEEPWDGPQMKTNLKTGQDEKYYHKAFAWQDPDGDPSTKVAYKFIHHMVAEDGDIGAANVKGCQGVIGVLNGARGGSNIPDADRKGVYDHVAKHLRDAGVEPPELQNAQARKFWQFKNTADNGAELLLYGEIWSERSWFDFSDGGIYADEFVKELQELGNVSQITCRINSVGGDIFAAVAIYTQLKTHAARVVCIVDGLAASAATFILMAADEIQMPAGAMVMIHDPMVVQMGYYTAADLTKVADTLNTIKNSIISIYAARTGTSEAKLSDLMTEETWMTADDAVKLGFCDKKIPATIQAQMKGRMLYMNGLEHDLSGFKTLPELEHARNIAGTIIAANSSGILSQFVAMANSGGTQQTDPPPNEGGTAEDKKKSGTKGADETIDDAGTGPMCDDCKDGDCGGCPCADCTKDSCKDCSEDSHADKKGKKAIKNLMAKYPRLTNQIIREAKAEERERLQEIDRIANQMDPSLVAKAKYETCTSAKDLLYENAVQSQAKGSAYLGSFRAQTETSGVKDVGSAPNTFTDRQPEETRAAIGDFIAKAANAILHKGRQ